MRDNLEKKKKKKKKKKHNRVTFFFHEESIFHMWNFKTLAYIVLNLGYAHESNKIK